LGLDSTVQSDCNVKKQITFMFSVEDVGFLCCLGYCAFHTGRSESSGTHCY